MKHLTNITVLLVFSMITYSGKSQQLAFPTAEGSGRFSTGGRGGDVYEVTTLSNSGSGSIVDAVKSGNRTIVFRVSGTIELGSVILIPKSNTTIAGQTAPGDGICIKGRINIGAVSNVVIRYIRVRVDEGGANSDGDAIDIAAGTNIIIDHVSASYARDEGISCQEKSNNVTVQWCIISEGLTFEGHSYGSLVRGDYGDEKTYHHNLYAHNWGRNPRPGNYTGVSTDPEGLHFDFRNNVVYNWKGSKPGYNQDDNEVSRYNFIGNVYIRGAESSGSIIFRENSLVGFGYFENNSYEGVVPDDPWSLVDLQGFNLAQINAYKARSYLVPMEPVTTTSPEKAKKDVLALSGASFPKRDIIDTRIVNDVLNKTGLSITTTDDQPEGAWPVLSSLPAPVDTDHDGMPDDWEDANSLDKNKPDDRNTVASNGYTMLEVYLYSEVDIDSIKFNDPVTNIQFWRAGDNNLRITWIDSYFGENGFIIEKSIDGINFSPVDSVANNVTEYIDSSQSANPNLQYRIVAFQGSFVTPYPTDYIENTSIEIATPKDIYVGDTVQMLIELMPENSHNRVIKWDVLEDDLSKAIINNYGQLIALDSGMIQLTVETTDGLGVSDTISLHINDNNSTDIQESNVSFESFDIYPNPFTNKIEIRLHEKIGPDAMVHIYNGIGRMMMQAIPGSEQSEIGTESLPKGIYLLSIQNNGKISNRVIIKN